MINASPKAPKAHRLPPLAPARRASFEHPARHVFVRPTLTKRSHPDLTGFLAGCVTLLLALFLVTAAGTHIRDRAAQTVAQGLVMRGM